MYARSDVYFVMMMFIELFLLKKISDSQAGLKPTTFWSPVSRSNHWAISTQTAERTLYFGDQKVEGLSPAWELRNVSEYFKIARWTS